MRVRSVRTAGVAVAGVAAVGALFATATPSTAAPLKINYAVTGSTDLTGLGAALPLGPGAADVEADLQQGNITGTIDLPETKTKFLLAGILDTHAKVKVTPNGPLTGTIKAGVVDVAGDFTVQITEVGHFDIGIPLSNCKTTEPVRITLTSGAGFNPAVGGTLTGNYKLPKFADCFVDTEIINFLVVGKDNPISIDLKAK
ncbi:hypothetical protein ACOBQX_06055 [Actinokineospora sp. G85]|uniref:hypothetical protein n=1 Tax=Actinokineospora sp. G85 TaxID=3406626 RepID=UPI003C787989